MLQGIIQPLSYHWRHEIPTENQPGQTWQQVKIDGKSYHKHLPTGEIYRADANEWAAAKTIAVLWIGGYYHFGAALARHLVSGMWETGSAVHQIYANRKTLKTQEGYSESKYLSESLFGSKDAPSMFKPAALEFYQAAKDAVVFAPFYYNSLSRPFIYSSILYTLYNPQQPRVALQKIYDLWRREETAPIADRIDTLDAWQFFKDCTDGRVSLLELFQINKIPQLKIIPEDVAEKVVAAIKVEKKTKDE